MPALFYTTPFVRGGTYAPCSHPALYCVLRSSRLLASQASLHLRRHDGAQARGRARALARWQVGALQRRRCRSRRRTRKLHTSGSCRLGRPMLAMERRASRPSRRASAFSFPIRTATARAGRRMANASRFFRPKKADRKYGSQTSIALRAAVTGVHKLTAHCHRSQWRTLVAGRQEHPVHFRCLSRMRWRARCRAGMQREETRRAREIQSQSPDLRSPAVSSLERIQRRKAQPHFCRARCPRLCARRCARIRNRAASAARSHSRRLRRARVLARRPGQLRLLARRPGSLLRLESRQGRSDFDQQRPVARSRDGRRERRTSPPTIPPATRRRCTRPMESTSRIARSSGRGMRAIASG